MLMHLKNNKEKHRQSDSIPIQITEIKIYLLRAFVSFCLEYHLVSFAIECRFYFIIDRELRKSKLKTKAKIKISQLDSILD